MKEARIRTDGGNLYPDAVVNDTLRRPSRWNCEVVGICALLVILVILIFGQTLRFDFVNYDDALNVSENAGVVAGISLSGIAWAFTHTQVGRWAPVTAISRQFDCQFYGLWAGGHHLTNLLLHALVSVLLFLLLLDLTRSVWRGAFVAAVFALHPLHVECVAWVSARGDLLCAVFFLLSLSSYANYARGRRHRIHYVLCLLWFTLGLMSKSMIVTLPFVLLLLDYWPLGRFREKLQLRRLLIEKVPFLVLSAASCAATVIAQEVSRVEKTHYTLALRVGNALVGYVIYLGRTIYPFRLAVLYPPLPNGWSAWQVMADCLLVVALTAGAIMLRRKQPYLPVGWLWYLGMLVPVSGIMQVGAQVYTDRYTYLPHIGLCMAGTWAVGDWAGRLRHRCFLTGAFATAALCILAVVAYRQTSYWRDSVTLWTHTLESTQDNADAHNNLGTGLARKGRQAEAIDQFREALKINPAYIECHANLALSLDMQGRAAEALLEYRKVLEAAPDSVNPLNNLAWLLATNADPSVRNAHLAMQLAGRARMLTSAQDANVLDTLAAAYAAAGRFSDAVQTAKNALQLAESKSNTKLVGALRREIKLYEACHPYEDAH